MRRLRASALLVTVGLALGLTACSTGPSNSVQVTYEIDGAERTLTFSPDQITCTDDRVHGLAISNDPQGRFSIDIGGQRRGSVGAGGDDGLVLFEGTDLQLSASGNVLTVGESEGEVAVVADWKPGDDANVEPEDADRYPATISGSIECDAPVAVPTAQPEATSDPTVTGVSVRFTGDGISHTATFEPSDVSCDSRVTATGVQPHPGTLALDSSGRLQVSVVDDTGTTQFVATGVSATPESDGSYWLQNITGDVSYWEGETSGTLSPEDAVEASGTLSALIICP
ncbi:hypothetical protein [Agromyces atrinae]|uniref:Uncharacterized protein n=1 Tax=Agromyces atrinae TaxID=592376 RepID=A0A4Q2MDD8_9MICO|nr:hypothetical protein [Agromyces atrinae]NYD67645.1 hypothetical protein [Agromyces atrinae]RXZ88151.1 hypothetical protein ESP50_02925 [Agromyces atrinae]